MGSGDDASSSRSPSTSSGTSARRPGPASPRSAISPTLGPTKCTPSASSSATLRRVAGLSHMRGFMAGATSTGLSVAISTQEARSSAWPPAILASRSAVAGATTISVGLARQADVADLALVVEIEQLGEHAVAGERADRQRRDELLRRPGHDRAHGDPALAQAADQLQALVGGDAAADDEHDALGAGWLHVKHGRRQAHAALRWPCRRAPCRPS